MSTFMTILHRAADPTVLQLQKVLKAKGRDLNQCLEEERQVTKLKPSRMTPLYANTGANNAGGAKITTNVKPAAPSAGGKRTSTGTHTHFHPFDHPYVLIEEGDLCNAPIHKQYPPTESGRVTFPVLRFDLRHSQCPFYYGSRPRPDNIYFSALHTIEQPEMVEEMALAAKTSRQAKHQTKHATFGGDPAKRQSFNPKCKPGYCEVCHEKYERLRDHVAGERHRVFARNHENYEAVDAILQRIAARPVLYDYNPIVTFNKVSLTSYSQSSVVTITAAPIMSPAQSTVHKKTAQIMSSSLRAAIPLPSMAEDKENDSPSGLDLTGIDRGLGGYSEKRRIMTGSSEMDPTFVTASRKKQRRASLVQSIKF